MGAGLSGGASFRQSGEQVRRQTPKAERAGGWKGLVYGIGPIQNGERVEKEPMDVGRSKWINVERRLG
jgi:hypothetical protein